MATLPAQGQPISFSQIQSFVSSTYSVNSTSIRTLSNAAGKGAPDSMSEFAAIPIIVWARNRAALSRTYEEILIKYQISTTYNAFNFSTLTSKSIGTSYVNMGTILVDPGQISNTNRLRIGCQFTYSTGGTINVGFGQGNGGTNWTFYCGITSGGHYPLTTTPTDIYLNINVVAGQYNPCG